MIKNNLLYLLPLGVILGSLPFLNTNKNTPCSASHITEAAERMLPYAVGPGITNLSIKDKYATYQWAFKNDGEFQLTELTSNFSMAKIYSNNSAISGDGIFHLPGPDTEKISTTRAVPGVDINMKAAWDVYDASTTAKRDVVVAVIDSGIDFSHPDLVNCAWVNPGEVPGDGIDNDGNGYVDDINGWDFYYNNNVIFNGKEDTHGTHNAGTIAASRGDNGIAGITDNSHVKIMSLKALGGEEGSGSPDAVINAIKYAEANGASICNLSFGTDVSNETLSNIIRDSKMLFVIASGNGNRWGNGYSLDQLPIYPAAYPHDNIISVANLMFDGSLSNSSNFGPTSVDIAAPGCYILSTVPDSKYSFYSGTSMAAPMVTGVAAMLYSYKPELSLSDVKKILLNSSRKMDSLKGRIVSGGMLDAYAALTYNLQ